MQIVLNTSGTPDAKQEEMIHVGSFGPVPKSLVGSQRVEDLAKIGTDIFDRAFPENDSKPRAIVEQLLPVIDDFRAKIGATWFELDQALDRDVQTPFLSPLRCIVSRPKIT
jgi:hypothetical protein